MGRSKKRKSDKERSGEKSERRSDGEQKEETKPLAASPKKSSSGVWNVVKVASREQKDADTGATEKGLRGEETGESSAAAAQKGTMEKEPKSPATAHSESLEEEHNTSPFKKSDKGGHRKRNYRDSSKGDNMNDGKKSRKEDSSDRNSERHSDSRDWGRQSRDRPHMLDIGGRYSPGSTAQFDRHPVDKGQKIKYSIFELENRKEALILLKHPSDIVLWGKAEVQVVWGSVTVMGYTMTHTSLERWPVYSPSCNSYIKLHTLPPDGSPGADLCKYAVEAYVGTSMDQETLKKLLGEVEQKTVILSLNKLEEKYLQFIRSISPFQDLFPTFKEDSDPLHKLGITIVQDRNAPSVDISFDMKNVQQELLSLLEDGQSPVFALCGGKNVGKSTMGRFLVNTVLNHRKEVAYLECDVGQTEFTPPACLALSIVRQPLLGPPFTHQRQPERMCFFGAVSPADDPGRYLHCLRHVFEAYRNLPEKPVLIVNTMGWNKGLGLTFMADTLRMVSPTVVVQINTRASEGRNFPMLNTLFVHNTPSWWQNQDCDSLEQNNYEYRHKLIAVESPVGFSRPSLKKYEPPDHRNLSLLSNLGHMYDTLDFLPLRPPTLHTLRPYKVPWNMFALHVCHAAVPNTQIMNALNGGVVAMCHVPESDVLETEAEELPDFLSETPVSNCLGFGVVRSIDPTEKCIYILTPMCQTDLVKVNCLLKGSLDLPRQILMAQPSNEKGEVPYVGEPLDLIGAFAISRRRHMQRRRPAAVD